MSAASAAVLAFPLATATAMVLSLMNAAYAAAMGARARRVARTRLRATTIHSQFLTMVHVCIWMRAACAAAQERFMHVAATTFSLAPAIAKGTSRTSAAYAMAQASLLPLVIAKATLKTNAACVEEMETRALRVVRIRLHATTIQPRFLKMAHAHTSMRAACAAVQERFMSAVAMTSFQALAIATGMWLMSAVFAVVLERFMNVVATTSFQALAIAMGT